MRSLLSLCLTFALCGLTFAEEVSGRVVDAEGRPVAGARVALFWTAQKDGKLTASEFATTDAEGRYRYELPGEAGHDHDGDGKPDHAPQDHAHSHGPGQEQDHDHSQARDHDHVEPPTLLFVVDAAQERGGFGVVEGAAASEVRLEPLVTVKGKLFVEKLGADPEWWSLTVSREGARVLSVMAQGPGPLSFKLPKGSYRLVGEATKDHRTYRSSLALDGERVEHWLGEVSIEATPLGRAFGGALPAFAPTDARGVKLPLDLKAYRGRWVLIIVFDVRFQDSLVPLLRAKELVEDHPTKRDKFEVFGLQRCGLPSIAEVEKRIAPLAKRFWDGKPFPFPLLLDGKGETLTGWGTDEIGRMVLLDINGRVVRYGDLETLRQLVARD